MSYFAHSWHWTPDVVLSLPLWERRCYVEILKEINEKQSGK